MTRPLPKLRSTTSGAPLRRWAAMRTPAFAAGRQPFETVKYRCTVTVCK